jgi:hypothetical protein
MHLIRIPRTILSPAPPLSADAEGNVLISVR